MRILLISPRKERPMLTQTVRRISFILPLLMALPCASFAHAQTPPQGKTFDVVSIRQNLALGGSGSFNLTPSPDGFRVTHVPLLLVLMTAYTPQAGGMFLNNIENAPDWLHRDTYDIDTRISDADRAAWNDPKNQPAMLQEMLQAMLADRFKFAAHRTMKTAPVYDLIVTKGGPKFQETKPDEPRPSGATLPGGGVMGPGADGATHMYNFSMGLLCALLSEKSERPVVDKTGLTGHYSIDIREPARMAAPSATPNGPSEDDRMPAVADVLKSVGLELKPAKEQVEWLVIDHMEKPTAN
jgi:uncharacterized protein (TIGR03435 family)